MGDAGVARGCGSLTTIRPFLHVVFEPRQIDASRFGGALEDILQHARRGRYTGCYPGVCLGFARDGRKGRGFAGPSSAYENRGEIWVLGPSLQGAAGAWLTTGAERELRKDGGHAMAPNAGCVRGLSTRWHRMLVV